MHRQRCWRGQVPKVVRKLFWVSPCYCRSGGGCSETVVSWSAAFSGGNNRYEMKSHNRNKMSIQVVYVWIRIYSCIFMHLKNFLFCNLDESEIFIKQCGCDGSFLPASFFSSLIWGMVDFRDYQRLIFLKHVLQAFLLFCKAEHCFWLFNFYWYLEAISAVAYINKISSSLPAIAYHNKPSLSSFANKE